MIGQQLGPYEVLAMLGEGGMGTVYRARDSRLGREVAIKVIRESVAGDRDRRQRFIQEAKAVSALNHPAIVTVYDIGVEGDVVFMVMELVVGQSLAERMPAGGFSAPDVLRIGSQIADACAAAHSRQIIHRDLKPANIMLMADGRVKILDFGLAKLLDQPDAEQAAVTQTAAGTILGTAAYMSPEQAQGRPLDARTDIFSLGAVLYELATGRRAFVGESQATVLAEVLKEDPSSPSVVRAELPPELSRLIMRCLRKDPERRVQSMADLRAALDELKDELASNRLKATPLSTTSGPVTTSPARNPARRSLGEGGSRMPLIAGGGVLIAAAVAAVLLWPRGDAAPPADTAQVQPVPLTSYAGSERAGGFSPDGNQVVFSWDGEAQDNFDIYVILIGPGTPLRLTSDPARDVAPRWSPDGRLIAFFRSTEASRLTLKVVPALGGAERSLGEFYPRVAIMPYADLAWAADSKHLFLSSGRKPGESSHLQRVNVDTGEVVTVATVEASSNGYFSLDVSPDGRRIAATRDSTGTEMFELFDLGTNLMPANPRVIEKQGTDGINLRWTADSKDLLFRPTVNNPLPLYRITPETGKAVPLLWLGPGASDPVVARTGNRMVFTRDFRDTNIWRVTIDGTRPPERVAVSSFRDVAPQYSPDGKRLAFHSNRGGTVQIWVADADGSKAVQLTSMDAMATTGTPRWSPDGRWVIYDSNAGGGYHLYVISAEGGQPRALTSGGRNFIGSWSPDSRWIYFTSDRGGQLDAWRVAPGGGEPEQVTRSGTTAAIVSPDGKWLYFTKAEGVDGLFRQPIDGGEATRVVDAIFRYNFVATNDGVYYVALPREVNGRTSVRYLDLASRQTREIAPIDSRVDLGLTLSPDGKHLLFTKIDYVGADLMLVEKFR